MNANPDSAPATHGGTTTAGPSPDCPPIVAALVALRKANRKSQRAVAAAMGTSQSAVSELESGLVEPRLSTLTRYADACGAELVVTVSVTTKLASLLPRPPG